MTGDDTVNIESAIRLKEYFQRRKVSFWKSIWKHLCGFKNKIANIKYAIRLKKRLRERKVWGWLAHGGGPSGNIELTKPLFCPCRPIVQESIYAPE